MRFLVFVHEGEMFTFISSGQVNDTYLLWLGSYAPKTETNRVMKYILFTCYKFNIMKSKTSTITVYFNL